MRRQRNMAQIKEQTKTSEKELSKMETSNLPDAELKTLVIRMLGELQGKGDKLSENFNKKVGNIKSELKDTQKEPVRDEEYIIADQQWNR